MRNEKRYRIYPKKNPIRMIGPTKWIYHTIPHPWIKNKSLDINFDNWIKISL